MKTSIIILSGTLISGILTIYFLNYIINSRVRKKLSANENPVAVSFLKGGIFIGSGLIIMENTTSFQALINILPSSYTGDNLLIQEVAFFCMYFGILLAVILTTFYLSILMFSVISKGKNIFLEVANDNMGAVIMFMGIFIALILAAKSGVTPLLDSLIPFPSIPVYR